MATEFMSNASSGRPWTQRYRDLRRRVRLLEAMYEDRKRLDRIMASGRYFKLAVATARAYEQIEKEFSWRRLNRDLNSDLGQGA